VYARQYEVSVNILGFGRHHDCRDPWPVWLLNALQRSGMVLVLCVHCKLPMVLSQADDNGRPECAECF